MPSENVQVRVYAWDSRLLDRTRERRKPPFRFPFLGVRAPEFRVSIGGTYSNENGGTLRNWYFRYHLAIYASNRPREGHEDILARPR